MRACIYMNEYALILIDTGALQCPRYLQLHVTSFNYVHSYSYLRLYVTYGLQLFYSL